MSLFQNYFGKENITDITYEDVVHYFSEAQEENDKIEYKSYSDYGDDKIKDKRELLLKSICGFLNSEGGLLIWGAPTGKKVEGHKEKVFQGELALVEQLYEKDAFISKITDSITPTPKGILFHRIKHEEKYLYLIDVPKSEYSPHQTGNIYYMRIDGQTKPAPHHYVEALFKKVKFPDLRAYLKIESFFEDEYEFDSYHLVLNVSVSIYNFTKLQNDQNLHMSLSCTNGIFYQLGGINNKFVRYSDTWNEAIVDKVRDTISYGSGVVLNFKITFDIQTLSTEDFKSTLILIFGAKYSPMKFCRYQLKFTDHPPTNIQDYFVKIEENVAFHEFQTDHEAFVLKKLGRTN